MLVAALALLVLFAAIAQALPGRHPNIVKGGFATWYTQEGILGACEHMHEDTDFVAAIAVGRYGYPGVQSPLCDKRAQITNTNNGMSVNVTIVDACPTCVNDNCMDLSCAAFNSIATYEDGMVPIEWHYL